MGKDRTGHRPRRPSAGCGGAGVVVAWHSVALRTKLDHVRRVGALEAHSTPKPCHPDPIGGGGHTLAQPGSDFARRIFMLK